MLKQWRNENLNVIYFYVPNSKNNEILTSDGVLLPYDEFKSMTAESYANKKNTNGGYDYQLSKQSEKLVKKAINTNEFSKSSNSFKSSVTQSVPIQNEIVKPEVTQSKEIKTELPQKKIKVPKVEDEVKIKNEDFKYEKNLFDIIYPKLMLVLAVVCSALSIYFTGCYLQRLQNVYIAYSISSAMLLYGLVGSQMTRRAFKSKHYLSAIIFGITATCTIGFSMLSSIDVNYAKYKVKHEIVEKSYNTDEGKKISYDLLKEELYDNKKQIGLLNEDIKFQQTQWSIMWDSELKKNIVLEGRISATAQQKITDDNIRIEELNKRNREINQELRNYAEGGIAIEKVESKTDRAKSLCDLVGAMIGVSSNVIQLIFLLIPSFFIDIINVLSLQIYLTKFEKKEEKY